MNKCSRPIFRHLVDLNKKRKWVGCLNLKLNTEIGDETQMPTQAQAQKPNRVHPKIALFWMDTN
jgi:hypothetical protein